MKNLSTAIHDSLDKINNGEWDALAGVGDKFDLEDGDYIGLPTADNSWNFETFAVDEYKEVKSKIASGEIVVDNSSDDGVKPAASEFTNVTYIQ